MKKDGVIDVIFKQQETVHEAFLKMYWKAGNMNKRIVVVYKSVTGFTKQYAQWIAEAIDCDIKEISNVSGDMLQQYDTVIYGGGLCAGGVSGMKQFVKLYPAISDKELILFTCGIANTELAENIKHIEDAISKAIPKDIYTGIKQFHLRGGIDYSKLSAIHRMMMWMLYRTIKKKGYENLSEDDKMLVDTYGKQVDFSDRKTIKLILDYLLEKSARV